MSPFSFLSLQYAIKSIRKNKINSEHDLSRIRREIEIMATLSHPHIITVHEGELKQLYNVKYTNVLMTLFSYH